MLSPQERVTRFWLGTRQKSYLIDELTYDRQKAKPHRSLLQLGREAFTRFKHERLPSLPANPGREQLMATSDEKHIRPAEILPDQVNSYITISSVSLTLSATNNLMSLAASSAADELLPVLASSTADELLPTLASSATGGFFSLFGLLSLPGFIYTSMPVYKATYADLKQGKVTINSLLSLTLISCLLNGYWFTGNLAVFFSILSRKLLAKVRSEAQHSLLDAFQLPTQTVWIWKDSQEIEITYEQLQVGDTVIVHAGEVIPVDGTITSGIASIDQHILTGEVQPAEKEVGDAVFAMTTVLSGRLHVRMDRARTATIVAQISEILNNSTRAKSTLQLRVEDLADKTVVPTLALSACALPLLGVQGATVVLFSHFRYKLSVIAPITMLNFLNLSSRRGVLIKEGLTLDLLNQVDTLVFDKTGTLTETKPTIAQIHCFDERYSEQELLRLAAAAEYKQTHPVAKAILQEAAARRLVIPQIDETEYKVGYGLSVTVQGGLLQVGSLRFIELVGLPIGEQVRAVQDYCYSQGHSFVVIALDGEVIGGVELHATVRPEARAVIQALRQRHQIRSTYIISGDHEAPTRHLAETLGIDRYFAQTLPQNKADLIKQLRAEGKFVCYIGDGINDSIALQASQVSISLSGASTIATDTAQIILMDGTLRQLVDLFDLGRQFEQSMKTNFAIVLTPMIIGISGAFLLQMNLLPIVLMSHAALLAGLANSTVPLLIEKQRGLSN